MANQIRAFGLRQIDPTGKSLLIFRNGVKPRNQKYSAFAVGQISARTSAVPCPQEGRFAIVTDVGCGSISGRTVLAKPRAHRAARMRSLDVIARSKATKQSTLTSRQHGLLRLRSQ